MIYPPVVQTPVIDGDLVVAWILRVRAEDGAFFGLIEERVEIPTDQQRPIKDWDVKHLESLLKENSERLNMHYRATKMVMDAKEAAATGA